MARLTSNMKICLIDADTDRLAELAVQLRHLGDCVEQIQVPVAIYTRPPTGLDAIFMTLPAAERWKPDFKSRRMQILRTATEDQAKGFPRFVVTGVDLRPEDPQDPVSQVGIVLKEAITAANEFSKSSAGTIETLGFWVMDLTRGVSVQQVAHLIQSAISSEQLG
jgi:hypothetical protein